MNQADSEKIHMIFLQSGFKRVHVWQDAHLVIFNTCSVRQKGEDRVFGMIQEIYKENLKNNTQIRIGITGCMVRKTGIGKKYLDTEILKRNKENSKKINLLQDQNGIFNYDDGLFPRSKQLDFTFRIEEIRYLPHILTHIYGEKIGNDDKFDDYLKAKQLRESMSSAQIIIQTGCDNYCSFCIVPFTRGKEISRTEKEILTECREAINNGAKEINLIGQNVNSYGKQFLDKKLWNTEKSHWNTLNGASPFGSLLGKIDQIQGLDRLRFTSSNPHDMTQDILDSHFQYNSLCNYLHFALQSGSNAMLKKMNRKHSYEDFRDKITYLRNKDPFFSISTDIIVGFSGETEEMFEETKKAFIECQFDFCFTARYSVRKDTLASKLYPDNISEDIKAQRWHILNDLLLENILKRNTMMLGRKEDILIAGEKDDYFFGRTRNFKEVFFEKHNTQSIGDIVSVKITDLDRYVLKAKQL